MKLYQDKEWLYQKYIIEKLSTYKIAELCKVCHGTILYWLHKFNIPIKKEEVLEKNRLSHLGKSTWNKGLTKEISEAIRRISEAKMGEKNPNFGKSPWNKGIKGCHTEKSLSHIPLFKKGHIPWNKSKKFLKITSSNHYRWKGRKKAMRERQKKDLKYRLNHRIRNLITCHMKKSQKKGRHWEDLVGYTVTQLKKRLQKTIPQGYIWQDFLEGKLHIDHIIPISAFNFTEPEHTDFKRCWSLNNLRLLPAKENIIKGAKLEKPFQPALAI